MHFLKINSGEIQVLIFSVIMKQAAHVASLSSQKSRESNTGLATSAGYHLHALLCESGGGRYLTNRFHLFQLLFAVFSGETMGNDAV